MPMQRCVDSVIRGCVPGICLECFRCVHVCASARTHCKPPNIHVSDVLTCLCCCTCIQRRPSRWLPPSTAIVYATPQQALLLPSFPGVSVHEWKRVSPALPLSQYLSISFSPCLPVSLKHACVTPAYHARTCTHMHAHARTCTHTRMHDACMHARTHACTPAKTHTHTQTHTNTHTTLCACT